MKTFPSSRLNLITTGLLVSALTACSAGSGSMEGKTTQQKSGKNKSNGTTYSSNSDETGSNSSNASSTDGSLPSSQAMGNAMSSNDTVSPPDNITGAYLYCFQDSIDDAKATANILCAVEDKNTNKPLALSSLYVSHSWSSTQPTALTVSSAELPAASYWQVQFTVQAQSKNILTAGLSSVKFLFEGTKIDNTKDDYNIVASLMRPDMLIKSLKPQTDSIYRCLDYYRMKGDKVVTTPCGVQSSAQDWYINPAGKIAHVSGICMKFNPVSKLAIEGDCAAGDTPAFEPVGQQLRIKGSTTCLALLNPDNSGVDYVGSAACNTSDNTQNWSGAKF